MKELTQFNWQAFDPVPGFKVSAGLIVVLALTHVTGETWMATGLAAMLAWLTNVPGSLGRRSIGMLAFAAGAVAVVFLAGRIGLELWPNVIAMALVGALGSLALAWGSRAFMVGWALICWTIYAPFLVDGTTVENCVLAVLAGTAVVIVLNAIAAATNADKPATAALQEQQDSPGAGFVADYAAALAFVLGLATWLGWGLLKTDATLVVGGAFFIIGFDARQTWIAGVARLIAVVAGSIAGLWIAQLLGPGFFLDAVVIVACFLCFATMAVHPGAFMFFLMIFVAIGWHGFEAERLELTFDERLMGETAGVLIAMAAIAFLQWWQARRAT